MDTIILGLIALAIAHFVFESIIAPTLRLKLRFELFKVRDELRALKAEKKDQLDDKVFDYLENSINLSISHMEYFRLSIWIRAFHAVQSDPALKERLKQREEAFKKCAFPETKDIQTKTVMLDLNAIGLSGGAWAVFVVPLAVLLAFYRSVSKMASTLMWLSDAEMKKVDHRNSTFAT
jgi:hypothetical protein